MTNKDKAETTYQDFIHLVNLSAQQLEAWLDSPESKSVGIKKGTSRQKVTSAKDGESIGHESGRMIVELLKADRSQLDDEDYRQMRRVIGFIRRHLAQGPRVNAIEHSRWRYSLMNWGHDPLSENR